MSLKIGFLFQKEHGSAVIEYVLLMPLALAVISSSITEVHLTHRRQLAVIEITREASRQFELGRSQQQVEELIETMADDAKLRRVLQFELQPTEIENASVLTLNYEGFSHSRFIGKSARR
jgi:hypothetical protein